MESDLKIGPIQMAFLWVVLQANEVRDTLRKCQKCGDLQFKTVIRYE